MRTVFWYQAILALAASTVSAQKEPQALLASIDTAVSQSRPAALKSLEILRKLASKDNYRQMGFESSGEASQAALGDPLVIFFVRLDELRKYRSGGDPISLLQGGSKVQYPVLVGKQVRSSITLDDNGRGWQGASYGGSQAARLVDTALREMTTGALKPPYFLVEVLALSSSFIGALQNNRLQLVPVQDDPQRRWKAGAPLPADTVLTQLASDAQAYNELPR